MGSSTGMLPNRESYTVECGDVRFEEVYDFLLLFLQTQTNAPTLMSTFQNLARNTCYSKLMSRDAPIGSATIKKVLKSIDSCENFAHLGSEDASGDPQYSSRVHLRDQIVTILHAMNDRSMKPGGTMLPISFNIREFLLENGVDLEEIDRFETQQRQADLKNKKHAYFLNVRQLATHFEGEIQKLNLFFTDYRNRLLSILSQQRFSRVIMPEESAIRIDRVQAAFNEIFEKLLESFRKALVHLSNVFLPPQPKRRHFLSQKARNILTKWFELHLDEPYPTEAEKKSLAEQCDISLLQVNYWFGNKRNRYKKKMRKAARTKVANKNMD